MQTEIDVIGINSQYHEQVIHVCEVVTRIDGMNYDSTLSDGWWNKYGSSRYQYTLEKLWRRFNADQECITNVFDDADVYIFEIWSPNVPKGILTDRLAELNERFESKHGHDVELVINEDYTARVEELQERAARDMKAYTEPAFRLLQILGNLR